MDWWIEPFLLGFQQRALLGGLVAGVMCSSVGVWIVLRGMSFFGDAFVHGVLPGIAAATLLGFSPYLGAALAAAAMVGGIELIHHQTKLKEDTAIGLLFVGMMALGVTIISKSNAYAGNLTAILFGDAFGVTQSDLVAQSILAAVLVAASLVMYRPLLALSFSPEKATTLGMRPRLAHAVLLVMIATAVIGSFQAVGTLLVFALLVAPPATASLISRTLPAMIGLSVVLASVCVWLGLTLSYHLGTAGAATMALVAVAAFFLVLTGTRLVALTAHTAARRAEGVR